MKKIINTTDAPAPIGPYSQAVLVNGFLYVSGQIAINPETGELTQSSITEETHQVMRNLKAVLLEADFEFKHVLKSTIFITDMNLFAKINEAYGSYFQTEFPARETVEVKGLPKGVNVEISVIAYKG